MFVIIALQFYSELSVRRWPTGNYAIPMSPYGCPIKPDDAWTQSSLNLTFGRDEIILSQINAKSMGHDLYVGPYGSYSFQLNFCVKTATEAESTVATAEREWPPGDYAVFAMGEDCPSGKLPQAQTDKHFQRKIENIFLPIILSIGFGCSKEPSQ